MSTRLIAAIACLCLLPGSAARTRAQSQSLADVARREAERRKTISNPSKVYTNADLRPAPAQAGSAPAADATKVEPKDDQKKDDKTEPAKEPATEPAREPEKEPKKDPVRDRAYWADRMKTLQEQLARDETYADALQSRINALTTDFVNRDDPAQKRVIEATRLTAIAELDRLKQRIPEDRKAIADFQDEARRDGIPPGWLR